MIFLKWLALALQAALLRITELEQQLADVAAPPEA